jgi:serine/threonine protein kinase
MVERGSSASGNVRGASTRTDVPLSDVSLPDVGLAATALDGETPPEAKKRSGAGAPEATPPPDGEPDPWIGRVLANVYKVEAKIGEGGMGAVYRATHVHLGKQVAVKVLTDAIAQKRDAVERLRQEAIAASSIDHDNIVDVVSFDRYDDGSVFIVMELLRGESLAERMETAREAGRALSIAQTVQIALQICDALGAAHERGIVHRDLKPENVFLARKGERERVKVLDFGISKIKTAEAEQVRMTRTGQLVGTPLYMSPEQARGETDIDRRVDVYALGVMLFEMLTGAPPFDGRNYFELLWKHGNEPPPSMRARKEGLPEALDRGGAARPREGPRRALRFDGGVLARPRGGCARGDPDGSEPDVDPSRGPSESGCGCDAEPPASARADRGFGPSVSRMPLYAALGVAALLSGVGIAWGMRGDEGPAPNPPTEAPATAGREPTPLPEREEREPEPPLGVEVPPLEEMVTVSFGGTPSGIEVVDETGAVLCVTPCMHDLPDGPPVVLSFRHDGYLEESRSIVPSRDAVVELRLRPRRRTSPAGEEGSGLHLKTTL